ncbi:DUF1648 domain-containing protein [Flavobacteriaceae bacterium S0825]|uniref:DUF1648 domain-containing protein n=1 Tax=Gaetbulibacter sp. S0825 TaxID=2720084 RepID=UPI00142FB737|nr:DUF1648 domain-containing protein [Gaetbulibacter sp. S0825]MCK0110202.1 DUF1648 domain-containing protein [Flavobacteriaceae bacterium S0825]NIX65831.1 DUF1648 domain-containing protein [Gaetbulibacter sp. S0825]
MNNKRPRIKVPFETVDIIIEFISITLLILMWVYCIVNYMELPDTIATHFNGAGEPDGYGSKQTVWVIPIIATVMYIGLFILNKYPHMHNYMVNITEENALKNYKFSTRIVRVVNFLCVLLMTYITYMIVESAFGKQFNLGTWFVPVVIGVSIILPIIIFVYMRKMNK